MGEEPPPLHCIKKGPYDPDRETPQEPWPHARTVSTMGRGLLAHSAPIIMLFAHSYFRPTCRPPIGMKLSPRLLISSTSCPLRRSSSAHHISPFMASFRHTVKERLWVQVLPPTFPPQLAINSHLAPLCIFLGYTTHHKGNAEWSEVRVYG